MVEFALLVSISLLTRMRPAGAINIKLWTRELQLTNRLRDLTVFLLEASLSLAPVMNVYFNYLK